MAWSWDGERPEPRQWFGAFVRPRRAQALGRLPWLAPFFLRERRLRPRLDIDAPPLDVLLVVAGREPIARNVRGVAGTAKLTR